MDVNGMRSPAYGVFKMYGLSLIHISLPAENADEKLVMEVAGGASYDIIQCSPDQFQTLMSQGALMPVSYTHLSKGGFPNTSPFWT